MLALLVRTVASLGAALTAATLLFWSDFTFNDPSRFAFWALLILAIGVTFGDVIGYVRTRSKRFPLNSDKISAYMCSWLQSGGLAAVFSRDLSWVDQGSHAETLLKKKAEKGELLLFVARRTDLIADLVQLGARVHDYSGINAFKPEARFTLINYGKVGTRLAIGVAMGNKHTITEFDLTNPTVMALAKDLVGLAQAVSPAL